MPDSGMVSHRKEDTMNGSCGTCTFGVFKSLVVGAPGHCIRFPPTCFLVQMQGAPAAYSEWAPIKRNHVCGEFKLELKGDK